MKRETIQVLKDGYWDRTTVIRTSDGSLRVRKESRPTDSPGPWARAALRNEVRVLREFSSMPESPFPPLLESWDDETIGYEIPYFEERADFARLVLTGRINQETADAMQRDLAIAIFDTLHQAPLVLEEDFATHLEEIIRESLAALDRDARFRPLISETATMINGTTLPALKASWEELQKLAIPDRLRDGPVVLLHGDLILENILWKPLVLIDPVSVAGLSSGHPLIDLVKYQSYASGELYAIREELVTAGPDEKGFTLHQPSTHPDLDAFRSLDLCSIFRDAHERRHGAIDATLYHLIDGYFSLVMARNTTGTHQWARVIKGCQCLAAATGDYEAAPS